MTDMQKTDSAVQERAGRTASAHARQDGELAHRKLVLSLVLSIIGFAFAAVAAILIVCDVLLLWYCVLAGIAGIVCGIVGTVQSRAAHRLGVDSKRCLLPLVLSLVDIILGTLWIVFVVVVFATYLSLWNTIGVG